MFNKRNLAVAIAVMSSAAGADTLTVGTNGAYSAEAVLDATVLRAASSSVTVTTAPTFITQNTVFDFDFGRATKNSAGGAFALSDLTLDYSHLGTNATNSTLTAIYQPGDSKLSYAVAAAPVFFGTWAAGATAAITSPRPYFLATGIEDVTLDYAFRLGLLATQNAASDSEKVLDVQGSQISSGTHDFSQVIDVESLKKKFITSGTASASTTLDLTIATAGLASTVNKNDIGTIAFVVTGDDFSWLDSDTTDTDTAASGLDRGYLSISGGTLTKLTATTIEGTISDNTAGATITISNTGNLVIPTQAAVSVAYNAFTAGGESVAVSGTGGGAWTLNGSSIDIYAIPTSEAVSNFIWLTNTGTGSTPVDVSIFDGAGSAACEMTSVATSVAGVELDLTAAVSAAVAAQCPTYVPSGNRVRWNVSASVPTATIRVSAAYRVGTDRVNLVTSTESGL
jgi:hypothetical protein